MTDKTEKLLYIAGPFDHADKLHGVEQNILNASRIALEAWEAGWVAVCPHKNTEGFQHVTHDVPTRDRWYRGDLAILYRCDGILLLPGWEEIPGSASECLYAIKNKIPVYDYKKRGMPNPADHPCHIEIRRVRGGPP